MTTRTIPALVSVLLLCSVGTLQAQKPIVTITTTRSSIPENPNQVTRTITTTRLSTTPTTSATFTVQSDRILRTNLVVQYRVSGTAVAGRDYSTLSGTVTILAGSTTASITVSTINDSVDELDETVSISLIASTTSPYSAGRPLSGRTTILDDDDVQVIGVNMSPDSVLGGRSRELRVTMSGAAPPGGVEVSVRSGNTGIVRDARATVAAGTRVGVATLSTAGVSATAAVPLTVSEPNGSRVTDTLVVLSPPAVQGFSFKFWDNYGGADFRGTFSLDAPAPVGGLVFPVSLAVVSPGGAILPASAPASVTVGAGQRGGSLTIASQPVQTATHVQVTLGSGSTARSSTIEVYPVPRVASVTATPDPVGSADSVEIRVRLEAPPVPRIGKAYYLAESGPVTVPGTELYFRPGELEKSARFETDPVAAPTPATVNVSADRGIAGPWNVSFTVAPVAPPAVLTGLTLNPPQVAGGSALSGTVTLSAPAPAGGVHVALASNDPQAVTLPPSVTVQAGATDANFGLAANPVPAPVDVQVTAFVSSQQVSQTLRVNAVPPRLGTIRLSSESVTSGSTVTGRIELVDPTGVPATVTLASSDPSAASVPASVTIPVGQTSTTFRVNVGQVAAATTVSVSATIGPDHASAPLSILPPPPAVTSLAASAPTVVGGGEVVLTATLSRPPDTPGMSVTITSDDPTVIPITTIEVPAGQLTGSVRVRTNAVGTTRTVRVSPTQSPEVVTIQLQPVPFDRIQTPGSVRAGNTITADLRVKQPAPAGGWRVPISSSDGSVIVPASVDIPPGATSVSYTVQVRAGAPDQRVTLSAGVGPSAVTRVVRVRP